MNVFHAARGFAYMSVRVVCVPHLCDDDDDDEDDDEDANDDGAEPI